MMGRFGTGTVSTIAVCIGLVGGCSNDDEPTSVCDDTVKTGVDDDADFSKYQTFAIFELDGIGGMGGGGNVPDDVQVDLATANQAAARQLRKRGLKEVDPAEEEPDLWIASAAATETEEGVYWQCVPGWYWWGWFYYWDPCAWLVPVDFDYTEGTMLVALVDSESKKPVFGGVVQGILECDDDLDGRIEVGVDEIFSDYPD